ncbi:MAG: hypothetical protein RI964_1105 [Pseudomonadota bacterium]|jgi:putative hemolysin
MKLTTGLGIALLFTLLSGCASQTTAPATTTPIDPAAARKASPATLNCLQNNGQIEVHQTPEGEKTDCVLPSGKHCDEWEMFRGNCPTRTVNANLKYIFH